MQGPSFPYCTVQQENQDGALCFLPRALAKGFLVVSQATKPWKQVPTEARRSLRQTLPCAMTVERHRFAVKQQPIVGPIERQVLSRVFSLLATNPGKPVSEAPTPLS